MNTEHLSSSPAEDRFCDLVMKGGIVSGIAYPLAVAELARHYRFHSIGGTSVGAVAAVVTAAAEYQRRQQDSGAGFKLLEKLPEQLGARPPRSKHSRLLGLFQPQPETRRLLQVLVAGLNRSSGLRRVGAVIFGLLRAYWLAPVLAAVFMALLICYAGLDGGTGLALLLGLGAGGWVCWRLRASPWVAAAMGIWLGLLSQNMGSLSAFWLVCLISRFLPGPCWPPSSCWPGSITTSPMLYPAMDLDCIPA